MSVRLLGKAFYADLPSHLKLLLLALCDEANDEGQGVFIGQQRLAEKCGTTDRSVRTNLKQLVDDGWLVKLPDRHAKYGTDQYEIAVERIPDRTPEDISGGNGRPEVQRMADRKSTVGSTGSGLPTTRELPVSKGTQELAPRKRDAIWDTLVEVYGEPSGSGRGARNAATKVLRDYGADPDEVRTFVAVMAGTDRDWSVTTPSALAKHYGERHALMAQVQNGRRKHDHAADLMREAMGE